MNESQLDLSIDYWAKVIGQPDLVEVQVLHVLTNTATVCIKETGETGVAKLCDLVAQEEKLIV
ncbi:hypothetical protein [Enterococcus sp. RIT-PI-f]|uniref:hypothetical protein n=1 Tax=Enterococcus sp. RIT-PI-f TaxID=1690244 RepID=UPI0006B8C337|nr:hypothetical protein [Enterococcus sp. RIT-PI-f]KPG73290.1 hypothetical protein AEQ18_01380 [Enterococcus sp. RIT-PI-f]